MAILSAQGASQPSASAGRANEAGAADSSSADARVSGATIDHPLTVLQVLPRLETGGVERGAVEIAQAIVAAGGRALVASAGGRLEAKLRAAGAEPITLPLATKNPLAIRANARRLADLIRSHSVDVVHARSRAPAWSARWAAARTRRPFVTTYHGVYTENLPLKRRYNAVMASGQVVIAISEFIAERVRARHRVAPERIVVIPRGADLAAFADAQVSAARVQALARRWGVEDDLRPMIMLPGRLTRWKGQALFIEALARLKTRLGAEAFHGVLVGREDKGGRFERELGEMIAAHQLERCVRLVGHCDDMPAAFKLADLAVSASLEPEAFGRVAVEAQAMGAPVVAAAHGGVLETVADGETGFLFAPGSAESLADALAQALALPEERLAAMRVAAIDRARAEFSVERMQAATLAVYERVSGRVFAAAA